VYCSNCGASLARDAAFCARCGVPTGQSHERQPIQAANPPEWGRGGAVLRWPIAATSRLVRVTSSAPS
jgi:predicted amidophosphoribosyltransferase